MFIVIAETRFIFVNLKPAFLGYHGLILSRDESCYI